VRVKNIVEALQTHWLTHGGLNRAMHHNPVHGRAASLLMARKKPLLIVTGIISLVALLAVVGIELTRGLSLTRGLPSLAAQEIYVMADMEKPYLSIDLDPAAACLKSIRVPLSEITLKVDPALPTDIAISSTDPYIWGDRWPWVEKVTVTLKTGRQKEGFDKLLQPEKLKQLQADLAKGSAYGVTHSGMLTGGGRILEN
jgi:hypothetical protein